ncbi:MULTISPECIES: HPr family phosphocarrier protein [Enterobacteriaceae]|uniref:Phosphocarrier protein NPr n=1 Tax=Raoultella lignicola TaxID=3040939 RepID=A0ABU9F2K8_9ENTR|nr:HPr family phosphocarrier protein [Enterobacter sp. JUb54]QNK07832.1 HPr family phosphocarrier protein [Enterobacter sp. JUb54]
MIRENIRVVNSTGLHARPAATIVKTLKKYESSVTLVNNGKETAIKGLMSVLGAGVKGKSSIEIICEGPDEQALMDEIKGLFASGFGEKEE